MVFTFAFLSLISAVAAHGTVSAVVVDGTLYVLFRLQSSTATNLH